MIKVVNYITEAFQELKTNVTWLSWSEVQRFTIIVALFSLLLSLAIWGIDSVFTKVITGFHNLING